MSDNWRWQYGYEYSDEPTYRSSMDVLVPDPTRTQESFGFSRALLEAQGPAEPDCWDDHAEMLGAA